MIKINVRIGTIDMDGYWGRDLHPIKEDSGKVAELISIVQQRFAEDPYDDMDYVVALMPDGRRVELVEHEILGFEGRACVGMENEDA